MPMITRSHQKKINSNTLIEARTAFATSGALDRQAIKESELKCKLTGSNNNASGWKDADNSPDIHGLFAKFNERFFWGRLLGVEVRWSSRMTSCAGVCVYKRRMNFCSIRLSAPLLKLRPHSDVVDTLLHEMIHAYLRVTDDQYTGHDSHGPKFHSHKDRINRAAGTNITVYHSFHEEVKLYKQHWWRCNGPCQNWSPTFGMVKRAMNRVPGPHERWWAFHKTSCGGIFTKIREPIEYTRKNAKNAGGIGSGVLSNSTNLSSQLGTKPKYGLENIIGVIDLTSPYITGISSSITTRSTERHGGLPVAVLDLTNEPMRKKKKRNNNFEICNCPVCNKKLPKYFVQEHLENCEGLQSLFDDYDSFEDYDDSLDDDDDTEIKVVGETYHLCPICAEHIKSDFKAHINECLNNSGIVNIFDEPIIPLHSEAFLTEINCNTLNLEKTIEASENNNNVTGSLCSICGIHVEGDMESHIDECLSNSDMLNDFDEIVKKCNDVASNQISHKPGTEPAEEINIKENEHSCPESINKNTESHINMNETLTDINERNSSHTVPKPESLDINIQGVQKIENRLGKTGKEKETNCPLCFSIVNEDEDAHLNMCLNSSGILNETAIEINDSCYLSSSKQNTLVLKPTSTINNLVKPTENRLGNIKKEKETYCPVCSLSVNGDNKTHINECLSNSGIFNEDIIEVDGCESPIVRKRKIEVSKSTSLDDGNEKETCPFCSLEIEGDAESHIDDCLNNSESIIKISDNIEVIE